MTAVCALHMGSEGLAVVPIFLILYYGKPHQSTYNIIFLIKVFHIHKMFY